MGSIFDATSQIALLLQLFVHCQITIWKSLQSSNSCLLYFLFLFVSFVSILFIFNNKIYLRKCPFNHELYVQCRIIYIISFFTWQTFNTIFEQWELCFFFPIILYFCNFILFFILLSTEIVRHRISIDWWFLITICSIKFYV